MKSSRLILILLLILVGCTQKAADPKDVEAAVAQYYEGIRLHDKQKMIDATTADFLLYEQGSIWNNDSVFREMEKYPYEVTFTFSNFNTVVDEHSAHSSYSATADFVFNGNEKETLNFIESAAFEKTGDRWKMSFLHVSPRAKGTVRYDTIHYAPEYLAERVAKFKTEPIVKGGIILLGNSIIEYGHWRKLLKDSSVVNRGVAADNTFGVLGRLDDVIARQPKKLFIEIGINDVSQSIPNNIIVGNIIKIVSKIHEGSGSTRIFVVSLLPTNDDVKNEYPDAFNKNNISEEINGLLKQKASNENFTFIDLASSLRDAGRKLDRRYAMPDGLHLNEDGYKIFARLLLQ